MVHTSVLARFEPISLRNMDAVALQSRMDTKYIFASAALPRLLEALSSEYRMLETKGQRGTLYRTLYFDTADRRHYFAHHNGRTFRSKVRMREYMGSGIRFLEVKRKTGRGGTDKRRIPIPIITEELNDAQKEFIHRASNCAEPLEPVLWNEFFRYTLVHRERLERVTIDTAISFWDENMNATVPGVCVAELKEGRTGHGSPFAAAMRAMPVPPISLSKYCIGISLLHPEVKHNQFKPVLLQARRIASFA